MTATRPAPQHACPLCGGPNGCVPARCGSFDVPCWCATAPLNAAALARVPLALRGVSCLCAACAQPAASRHSGR